MRAEGRQKMNLYSVTFTSNVKLGSSIKSAEEIILDATDMDDAKAKADDWFRNFGARTGSADPTRSEGEMEPKLRDVKPVLLTGIVVYNEKLRARQSYVVQAPQSGVASEYANMTDAELGRAIEKMSLKEAEALSKKNPEFRKRLDTLKR